MRCGLLVGQSQGKAVLGIAIVMKVMSRRGSLRMHPLNQRPESPCVVNYDALVRVGLKTCRRNLAFCRIVAIKPKHRFRRGVNLREIQLILSKPYILRAEKCQRGAQTP